MAGMLAIAGYLVMLIGIILIAIQAFKTSFLEGMASLVLPFYGFYFVHKDWENGPTRTAWWIFVAGVFLYGAAVVVAR